MVARTANNYDHHKGAQPLLRPMSPWRTAVFLAVNLAGFVAVNAFWQYLSRGWWWDFSLEAYRQDLATPLGEMFLRPLSLFAYPWMIPVTGLLLAVVIFVPPVLAILDRLVYAGVFVLVVAVIGHAPVLAVVLALGCFLAARTSLRSDMPFVAALLGMLPVAGYLYLFSFLGSDSGAVVPLQRLLLAVPLLVAAVAAVLASAAVLALASLTGFRPNVVWPVLVLLLAAPAALFYTRIGPDQLDYALIANDLAPGDAIFEPVALEAWRRANQAEGMNPTTLRVRLQDDLQRRQDRLLARCRTFLGKYPGSIRAPGILWVMGQAASLQLDAPALEIGLVKYTAAHPLAGSEAVWRELADKHGQSFQAALALWRIGELSMRHQQSLDTYDLLSRAVQRLSVIAPPAGTDTDVPPTAQAFPPPADVPGPRYYAEAMFSVRRLLWLLEHNDVLGDAVSAEAMAAILEANPCELNYCQRLAELAGKYEHTPLGDNLKLVVAMATPNLYERAEMLIQLAKDARYDVAVEANYELGRLTMRTGQAPALPLVENLKKPQEYFEMVTAAPPNPWQQPAWEHLASLRPASRTAATRP